jgi:hypothetical protein
MSEGQRIADAVKETQSSPFQSSEADQRQSKSIARGQRSMDRESDAQPSTSEGAGIGDRERAGTSGSEGGSFECNICLELAQDPVVTLCGHLFCWPCLYR